MLHNSVGIIITAFNEAQVIGGLITEIRHLYPDSEIIVIDDRSADQMAEVAGRAGTLVYRHPYNIGNGAAIKSGIRAAR